MSSVFCLKRTSNKVIYMFISFEVSAVVIDKREFHAATLMKIMILIILGKIVENALHLKLLC